MLVAGSAYRNTEQTTQVEVELRVFYFHCNYTVKQFLGQDKKKEE